MTTNQLMIVRDYLERIRWYYIGGFILHWFAMSVCWWMGKPVLIGVIGGSALVLMFELIRGGNAATRTMLSLPMTADQLARCWRFVALEFPALLFLVPLLLGALIGAVFGAPFLNAEFLLLIAIGQTLCLGVIFFALTGIPGQPRTNATLWQRTRDLFFGMLWGLSIPAFMFFSLITPHHFADLEKEPIIVGVLLIVATAAGWMRADVLVRERAARSGNGDRKINNILPERNSGEWKRFGAMPYFCLRFGTTTIFMFLAMLLINWIFLTEFASTAKHGASIVKSQSMMFVAMSAFVSFFQLLNQLRVLRAMPIRTSTLTHWLIFWPLGLSTVLAAFVQLIFWLIDRSPINGSWLQDAAFSVGLLTILLPLTLRFGLKLWTMVLMMILFGITTAIIPLSKSVDLDRYSFGLWVGFAIILACVWWCSFQLLATSHPWRAGMMKRMTMGERM
ncbi:MAG: hypothetical protein H8M99_04625 [Gloeobacteraceae cyanobacterium ES-bin-144]|nr:hypothetical protein [Verrucomicrobiales bacterium]